MYANAARVSWPPAKIFGDEITIVGSFSQTYMFREFCLCSQAKWDGSQPLTLVIVTAPTIDYLDSGKIKTKGIVNKSFKLEEFGEALESIRNKSAIKAAIVFE